MTYLMAHFLGDYFAQTDFMALGKKKSSWVCLGHVLTYLVPFFFVINYPDPYLLNSKPPFWIGLMAWHLQWWQIGLIGIQHFIQDRTNFVVWFMKAKGSGKFTEPPMGPWSVVVTDNLIHIMWIALVLSF